MATIIIADADQMRREGLATILSQQTEFQIVGTASDGDKALADVRRLRPEVVVLDLNLPKLYGTELVRRIRAEVSSTKIIVMAGSKDDAVINDTVRAGGNGYVLRSGPAKHLIAAIHHVREGGHYFSPQLTGSRDEAPPTPTRRTPPPVPENDLAEDTGLSPDLAARISDIFRPLQDRLDDTAGRVDNLNTAFQPPPPRRDTWFRKHAKTRTVVDAEFETKNAPSPDRKPSLQDRLNALGAMISSEPVTNRGRKAAPAPPPGGTRFEDILDGDAELSRNPGASLFGSEDGDYVKPPRRAKHRLFGSGKGKVAKAVWSLVMGVVISSIVGFLLYQIILSGILEKLNQG